MADPVRLNAPVSSKGPVSTPDTAAPAGLPVAGPTQATIDGRDRSRPNVTSAPSAGNPGLTAPRQTRPALRASTPQTIAAGDSEPLRTTGITAAAATPFVDESQRVMRNIVGIGLGRQPNTFEATAVYRDNLGQTHVRMQRMYLGVPVFGEQVITHFDKGGQVRDITNKDTPAGLAGLSIQPGVTSAQALATAKATMGTAPNSQSEPELVVLKQQNGEFTLAYHIILENFSNPRDPQRNHYFVDAQTNRTLLSYNEIHGFVEGPRALRVGVDGETPAPAPTPAPSDSKTPAPAPSDSKTPAPAPSDSKTPAPAPSDSKTPAPAPSDSKTPAPTEPAPDPTPPAQPQPAPGGLGNSFYLGDNVSLTTTKMPNGTYVMRDPSARNAEVRDARNVSRTDLAEDGFPRTATAITDDNNAWGEATDEPRNRAAIDAQAVAVKFDEYLTAMFDRKGIDGNGQQPRALVHVGDRMVNAFYYRKTMWYGDGDGVSAGVLVDKDVASHEPTHGLTETSSGLQYWGESGALNEAMSDILGSAGFSWYLRGHNDRGIQSDYSIGEDCWTPSKAGDALRYMDHPTRDREGSGEGYSRDHYSTRYQGWGDNGGVHLNSGIANNAFYLMANGGTNDTSKLSVQNGMGIQDALQIIYRANTVYFTPSTDFSKAREATVKAATDLFGDESAQVRTVQQAWTAVGVSAPPATPPRFPTPAPAPSSETPAPAPSSETPAPAPSSETPAQSPAPTTPAPSTIQRRRAA